ncbi:MAG: DUF2283 domain-containing protein [Burkholderiales bacterium]
MKVRYFADTDTLLIELRDSQVAETRELDENTVLDVDAEGSGRGYCAPQGAGHRAGDPALDPAWLSHG